MENFTGKIVQYGELNRFGRSQVQQSGASLRELVEILVAVTNDDQVPFRDSSAGKVGILFGLLRIVPGLWAI